MGPAVVVLFMSGWLVGCATFEKREVVTSLPESPAAMAQAPAVPSLSQKKSARVLKRKIAIARFTNEAKYGTSLFGRDKHSDRLGKQAADMLAAELTRSGKFIVLERIDLNKLKTEAELMGMSPEEFQRNLVGVDALIMGAVIEFGRQDTGEVVLFSRSRKQTVHAKVNVRLVDPRSAHVFFSGDGEADATLEQTTILGLGDRATFDSTLNDKAISAAIVNLMDKILNKLGDKPWTTGILSVEGGEVLIAGGKRQGLRLGDQLKVIVPGKVIKSPQTGFDIQLPHKQVGKLEVVSFFGDSETNEGSVCKVVEGPPPTTSHLIQF